MKEIKHIETVRWYNGEKHEANMPKPRRGEHAQEGDRESWVVSFKMKRPDSRKQDKCLAVYQSANAARGEIYVWRADVMGRPSWQQKMFCEVVNDEVSFPGVFKVFFAEHKCKDFIGAPCIVDARGAVVEVPVWAGRGWSRGIGECLKRWDPKGNICYMKHNNPELYNKFYPKETNNV